MERNRLSSLISAVFLLSLALYNFVTYTSATSQQSTFNLQPTLTYEFTVTKNPSDVVSGQFQENSGSPVSFYIQSSAQFAAFQANTSFTYLYGIVEVASGSVSYTFPVQDTYYLLFRHGTGLINTTETVYFQRSYQTHSSSRLQLGLIFVIFAAVSLVFVFRRRKPKSVVGPGSVIEPAQPPSTDPTTVTNHDN